MFENDVTIFLSIEGRKFETPFRDYQKELSICVNSIRQIYKKINIILFQPTPFDIGSELLNNLKSQNCIHIKDTSMWSDDITCGFDLKAVSGYLLTTKYNEYIKTNYILNIDLDMYLIRKIPDLLLNIKPEETAIGRYTLKPELDKVNKINEGIVYKDEPFDTGFILLQKDNNFFTKWLDDINNIRNTILKNDKSTEEMIKVYIESKESLDKDLQIDSIEEWLISYYFMNDTIKIKPLYDYQYGEFYPKEFTKKPLFFHHHYYPKDYKQNFWKRDIQDYITMEYIKNGKK